MADNIEKIGKYFAEQEVQLRRMYVQAAADSSSQLIVYRHAPQHQHPTASSDLTDPDVLPGRRSARERHPPSLLRRRFSIRSSANASSDTDVSVLQQQLTARGAKSSPGSVVVVVPPLGLSPSLRRSAHAELQPNAHRLDEHVWSDDEGFASWRSVQPHTKVDNAQPADDRPRRKPTAALATASDSTRPEVESSNSDGSDVDQQLESQASSTPSSSRDEMQSSSVRPALKRKGSTKKRTGKRCGRDKSDSIVPDAELQKRENEKKVAAALVLAQERAHRIQTEREQQLRAQELSRRDEQRRVQEEMDKIEAVRQKSRQFASRLRTSSAVCRPAEAEPSDGPFSIRSTTSQTTGTSGIDSGGTIKSVSQLSECAATTEMKPPGDAELCEVTLLNTVERQLRDRVRISIRDVCVCPSVLAYNKSSDSHSLVRPMQMAVELRIREKALRAHQALAHEARRAHAELERQRKSNERAQQRVRALDTTKGSLERELADAPEKLQLTRSQRTELEDAGRKERQQRVKDAEKQLRARVRTEERDRLADEERVRAEVAADARARAGQRAVSRAFGLKKKATHDDHEARRSNRGRSNNNADEATDDDLRKPRASASVAAPASKLALLLPPELAEFEEEGLLDNNEFVAGTVPTSSKVSVRFTTDCATLQSVPDGSEARDEAPTGHLCPEPTFEWRVPWIEDREVFTRVLVFEIPSP